MALNMEYTRKIEYFIESIPKRIYHPKGELGFSGFFTYDRLTFEQACKNDKQKLVEGLAWGRKWEYAWFFTKITIPESCKGEKVVFTAKLGECVVFVNGKVCGAFDKQHTHITLTDCAGDGEVFDIAMEVYAGHDGLEDCLAVDHRRLVIPEENPQEFPEDVTQKTVKNGSVGILYDEVFQLWMDIKTLYDLRNNLDENSLRRAQIDKGLKRMCDTVDIELPFEEFLEVVDRGRKILKPLLECRNSATTPTIYAIGNSHLDLEWLWTRNETRRKVARTLGNQLQLMRKYKDYKYIQSQPWILETVKNEYPKLYEEVKKAVANGNIIVEGGTWVQPDTNIPSGESLIRQFIFGKKFIADEFGNNSELFWLPDSFGVSGTMPQIMKGCGIKYFMNAKISWLYNGGDVIPHSIFKWKGIDGTEILTNIIQEYATEMTPSKVFEKWNMNPEKEDVPIRLIPYGWGDGGGGATPVHLEYIEREKDLEGMPRVEHKSPSEFFEFIENECDVEKTFVGELYYAAHRGTYTSQAKTKKLNRQSELALRDAEMWSALLDADTKLQTDALWKRMLFNQFHDIIPGTSITAVHELSEKDLEAVFADAKTITDDVFAKILDNKDDTMTVFNSLGWNRTAFVELPEGYTSVDGCETQLIDDKTIALVDVPACGFKSFKIGKEKAKEAKAKTDLVLENEFIKAEFNKKGELVSLISKETGAEFLSAKSNRFRMYQDMPTFSDSWDIDSFYEKTELELDDGEAKAEYSGNLYSSLIIKKKIHNSEIRQRVILRKNSRRLDFETEVDWNETHKLLKVDFNTNIHTEEMLSEIQFGHVKRPNHKNRQYDADRFEVWQHKWSALSESKRGFAILNDCKYGIGADYNRMSLTLLKAAAEPALNADKGRHSFTYSIMPFNENFCDSRVIEEAYELNCPVVVKEGFAEEKSLMNISENNIIIDTVKFAEDGSGDIIIRMYECQGTTINAFLDMGFEVKEAYITNMLEQNLTKLDVSGNEIRLRFKAFEIITLKVKKK